MMRWKRMDRFKLTKQDRINQYKIIMYNVKGDLEYYTRPDTVRRLDKMGSSMRPLRSITTAHTAAHYSIIRLPLRVLCWTIRTKWA